MRVDLLHAVFLAFSGFSGNLWCSFGHRHITLIFAFMFMWYFPCVSICVQISSFYKDTIIWIKPHPNDFILPWSSLKILFPKKKKSHRTRGYDFSIFCGGHWVYSGWHLHFNSAKLLEDGTDYNIWIFL